MGNLSHSKFKFSRSCSFWSLFTLAFFSFQRKSNLVVSRVNKSPVRRCDIKIGSRGLLITLHWTKTIQFGQKKLVIPVVHIPGSVLCPVRAYVNMCELVQALMDGPAFVKPFSGELVLITYVQYNGFIKQYVTKIGKNSAKFSSHSFRRGGATWAFKGSSSR